MAFGDKVWWLGPGWWWLGWGYRSGWESQRRGTTPQDLGHVCPRTGARPREERPDVGLLWGPWWLSRRPEQGRWRRACWRGFGADVLRQWGCPHPLAPVLDNKGRESWTPSCMWLSRARPGWGRRRKERGGGERMCPAPGSSLVYPNSTVAEAVNGGALPQSQLETPSSDMICSLR